MKLILLSDMHITSKQPRHRRGDIRKDIRKKLKFIFKKAREHNAIILQAGDFFDSPRDIHAVYEFIKIRTKFSDVKIYSIYGQHDSYMRNTTALNNLSLLSRTGLITILSKTPIRVEGRYNLYGASWKEEIPSPERDGYNILAVHKPIHQNAIYEGQDFTPGNDFLEKNKFDLILAGDIHREYVYGEDYRWLINTGPIIRLKTTDYKNEETSSFSPKIYLFDPNEELGHPYTAIDIPSTERPFDSRFIDEDYSNAFIDESFYKALAEKENKLSIDEIIMSLVSQHDKSEKIINLLAKMENKLEYR